MCWFGEEPGSNASCGTRPGGLESFYAGTLGRCCKPDQEPGTNGIQTKDAMKSTFLLVTEPLRRTRNQNDER